MFPWRPTGVQPHRQDRDTHDRHGIARCKHCGGPTEHVRFSAAGTTPRIWARCMIGATPDCAREFTIPCSLDWRLLIRLPRTHPLYHELKHSHESFEAVHDWHRDRYKVAADI